MPASPNSLIHRALRLSYATIGWNGIAGASGLALALIADSPATAGFALNALLDSSASVVLIWRFRRERSDPEAAERLERHAQKFIVIAMAAVAALVAAGALRALVTGSHAKETVFAILVTALSLLFLPWLGREKLVIAAALPSPALRGDGVLTLAARSASPGSPLWLSHSILRLGGGGPTRWPRSLSPRPSQLRPCGSRFDTSSARTRPREASLR